MSTAPGIPHDFQAEIFPDYVRIATGNAIIGAQYVERVLNAICLILQTDSLRFTLEDFMSGDSSRTRQNLGTISQQLRQTNLFDPGFSERLAEFTRRRNRVVHGLFADTFQSRDDINVDSPQAHEYTRECEWVADEASQLVEVGFGIYRALGELRSTADSNLSLEEENLIRGFDEFYDIGMETLAADIRAQIDQAKLRSQEEAT
jgi:hypothetical protein